MLIKLYFKEKLYEHITSTICLNNQQGKQKLLVAMWKLAAAERFTLQRSFQMRSLMSLLNMVYNDR